MPISGMPIPGGIPPIPPIPPIPGGIPPSAPGGGPADFAVAITSSIRKIIHAASAAAEAACMILRIDDVIATAKSAGPPPGAEGGMPPGMGGMGGMPPGMGMPDMGM